MQIPSRRYRRNHAGRATLRRHILAGALFVAHQTLRRRRARDTPRRPSRRQSVLPDAQRSLLPRAVRVPARAVVRPRGWDLREPGSGAGAVGDARRFCALCQWGYGMSRKGHGVLRDELGGGEDFVVL